MQNPDFYQQLSSLGHESGLSSNFATEYKLRVEDLSPSVNKARLHDIFAPHGKLVRVTIFDDREWLKGLNYALVSFLYQADLLKAIKVCNGLYIDGSKIKVSAARAETNPNTASNSRVGSSEPFKPPSQLPCPPRSPNIVIDHPSAGVQYDVQSYTTSFSSYSVYRAPQDQPRTSESRTFSSSLITARNQGTVYETSRDGSTHMAEFPQMSTQGNQGNVHITRESLLVSQHSVSSSAGTVRNGGSWSSVGSLATTDSHAISNQYTPRAIDAVKSVHFAAAPFEVPPWPDAPDDEDYHQNASSTNGNSKQGTDRADGEAAVALFSFEGNAADELSVREGEAFVVLDRSNDDWWKCRNAQGTEGVVPAQFVDLEASDGEETAPSPAPPAPALASRRAAEPKSEDDATGSEEKRERARERERDKKGKKEREKRADTPDEEDYHHDATYTNGNSVQSPDGADGEAAVALYDFEGDAADELSLREGEALVVLDRSNDDWWKCRNAHGTKGVAPAQFIDLEASGGEEPAPPAPVPPAASTGVGAAAAAVAVAPGSRRVTELKPEDDDGTDSEEEREREREREGREKEKKEREQRRRRETEEVERATRAEEETRLATKRKKAEEKKARAAASTREANHQQEAQEARRREKEQTKQRGGKRRSNGTEDDPDEEGDVELAEKVCKLVPRPQIEKDNGQKTTRPVPSEKMSPEDMKYIAKVTGVSTGDDDEEAGVKVVQAPTPPGTSYRPTNTRRGRLVPSKSTLINFDENMLANASTQLGVPPNARSAGAAGNRTSSPNPLDIGSSAPSSAVSKPSGFDDDAWTVRPSSTNPTPAAPASALTPPIASAYTPPAPVVTQSPPAQSSTTSPTIAKLNSELEPLQKIADLKRPPSAPAPSLQAPAPPPYSSFHSGASLQSQQTGSYGGSPNDVRELAAPLPANALVLVQPLVPTDTTQATGFRMNTEYQPQISPFKPQATGFQPPATGFHQQINSFPPQPTGFQGSMFKPQATGYEISDLSPLRKQQTVGFGGDEHTAPNAQVSESSKLFSPSSSEPIYSTPGIQEECVIGPEQTLTMIMAPNHHLHSLYAEEVADLTDQVLKTSDTPSFEGIYSFVYRGFYHGLSVAIKVLRAVSTVSAMRRKLRREMQTWWALNGHPNVLPLFGFHEDFGAFGAMISPWYRNGNSSDYLRTRWVHPSKRIELLLQVASVVAYLHAYDPQIIHGDLKPTNILIDDDGNARVCDFGLARLIAQYGDTGLTTTTAYTGTARYLAYELVECDETKLPTAASDVHALACVGFAFLYLDVPYAHRPGNQLTYIVRDIMKGVPPAKRPEGTTDPTIALLWDLLEACWALDPEERPPASVLAEFLIQYGKELEVALKMPF